MATDGESWVLDETAHAGRENLDARHVARYDGKEDADAAGELAALAAFGVGAVEPVVDLGAGTGQFTVSAAATARRNRAELEEHVRDEHSTFTWLLEPMISRAGFAIEQADYSADGMVARYICVKTRR